jgi:PleD family two-component response regulator
MGRTEETLATQAMVLDTLFNALAERLVNELLRKFSTIKFGGQENKLSATFYCGIAEYPCFNDLTALVEAADRAMYQAKEEGRNRVCVACN